MTNCAAQLYRLRERLRREQYLNEYDHLTFRLVDGDLCIIRRVKVPPVDDAIQAVEPAQMTKAERVGLPTWPRKLRRTAMW